MMKTIKALSVILIALISLNFASCSDKVMGERNKSDLEKAKLKGKVKSVKTSCYEATTKDGVVEKGSAIRIASDNDNALAYYDEKGNLTEEFRYYDEINDCYELSWYDRYLYKYDDKGHKIEKIKYSPSEKVRERRSYRYNDEGELIEEISFEADDVLEWKKSYEYDKEEHITHISWYKDDGSLNGKESYKYASQGGRLEKVEWTWYGLGDNFNGCETYKYDNQGNVIEEATYNAMKELTTRRTMCYDDKGNETEWASYNYTYSIELKRTYEYKYDNQGNWIQRIMRENGTATGLVERQIVYYD